VTQPRCANSPSCGGRDARARPRAVAIVAVVALDRAAKALVLADFDATAAAPPR